MKAFVVTLSLGFVSTQSYTVIAPGPAQAIIGATKWAEDSGNKIVQFASCAVGPELITVRESKPKVRRSKKAATQPKPRAKKNPAPAEK
jgi:hypothetical protein